MTSYDELVTAPDLEDDSLVVTDVRDVHLRAAAGEFEDDYIDRLIRVSYEMAERVTWRAHLTQTWDLVLDRFPCGAVVLPRPPLQAVLSVTYVDEDGAEQTWAEANYVVSVPKGPKARRGWIRPAYDLTWPTTRLQPDAVRVRYRAGYVDGGSPARANVPVDIDHGRLLVIGELYKQRSESVHAFNQNPALIRAEGIWKRYRAW